MDPSKPFASGLILFLVLFGWFASSDAKSIPISCGNSVDCTDPDKKFCWERFCSSCIPCEELYNRESPLPIDGHCAFTPTECGECLPGCMSMNTTGTPSIECQPNSYNEPTRPTNDWFSPSASLGIGIGIGLFVGIFIGILFYKKWDSIRNFCCCKRQAKHSSDAVQAPRNGPPTPGNNSATNPTGEPNQFSDLEEREETRL